MNLNFSTIKYGYVILAVLIFVSFFYGLGGYDLTAPDEPRFALVAREMLTYNYWILPHRNEIPYPDKPPLFFWTIAAASAIAGGTVTAVTARLPSAVAATLVVMLMFWWSGENRKNQVLPFLTALVLVSCSKFFFQARIAQIDMVLCFFVTASLIMGYRALTGESSRPFWLGICMGLGTLAKGPVAILIPMGSLAVFAAFSGRSAWRKFPLRSLLWMLVPILIWLALLVLDVAMNGYWEYLNNLLFKQTLVRYTHAWHHHQPFYYFFLSILYDFLPWTPFLIISIPFPKARWQSLDQKQKFSWCVILFTLVFFSLSKGKRSIYILPVFPFAAYITAAYIKGLINKQKTDMRARIAGIFSGVILLCAGVVLFFPDAGWVKIPDWIDAPLPVAWLKAGGGLLAAIAVGIVFFSAKARFKWAAAGIITGMMAANLLLFSVIMPWIDPYRSSRGFMEDANRIIHSHSTAPPVVGMVDYRSAFRLYGDFPLVELDKGRGNGMPHLKGFFEQSPDGWVIIREKDWKWIVNDDNMDVTIFLKRKIGSGDKFMLLARSMPNQAIKP